MSFIGSVSPSHRAIVVELAQAWKGRPIAIGCSGNFTLERSLAAAGHTWIIGNDVSLYSCAVGRYLTGRPVGVTVAEPALEWLAPHLDDGLSAVATILLCTSMLVHYDRPEVYHRRMWAAAVDQFSERLTATRARVERALAGLKLAGFVEADVRDYLAQLPPEAAFIAYPPTYQRGYERLYKTIDRVFSWDAPAYEPFGPADLPDLFALAQARGPWAIGTGMLIEGYGAYHRATVQETQRAVPMELYASDGDPAVVLPNMTLEPVATPRLRGPVRGPLQLARLTAGQLNTLRSEYLAPGIAPAGAQLALAVLADGELLGALACARPSFGGWCDIYLMSDFAVAPSAEPRLSKLVLAAALSTEVQTQLEQLVTRRVHWIGTTVFTDKPVSMKYRGLFTLHSRKDDPPRLNYRAEAGRWTLEGALAWWRQQHSRTPIRISSASTPSLPRSAAI